MPIFRINSKLLYFSHIPKCGGSSVEDFVMSYSNSTGFLDRKFLAHRYPWTKTSPQHIDGVSLNRLFNNQNFFDHYFTIVRHPISRFKSAFMFQKHLSKKISIELSINSYVKLIKEKKINIFGYCDNHFVPMVYFLMPSVKYKIFKLEEGLDKFKEWFKSEIHSEIHDNDIPVVNSTSEELKSIEDYTLNKNSMDFLTELYKDDYETFNYDFTN